MTNDTPLLLSTVDMNIENPTNIDHQSWIHENDSVTPVPQNHEQKPSSPYLMLSVGDNRHFGLSDFQDPLFYQQPLHFYHNQSVPSTMESGHETGDRARLTNEIKFNEYRKQKSISSHKHEIEKSKSTHRQYTNLKKSKNKMIKAKEKKKKVSTGNMNKRKYKNQKITRSNIQQLRYQSTTRQALLLKRRRQQQMLLKKKKKELLKQRVASKKRSMAKVNKNKSLTSSRHGRKSNTTNNRVTSTTSPRGSLTLRLKRTPSSIQPKTETTGIQFPSVIRLIAIPKPQIASNKIKRLIDISTLPPASQWTNKQIMDGIVVTTTHLPPTLSDILPSSCVHPQLSSKSSSSTRIKQKLSKKKVLHSKLNTRKLSTSKSKQIKQRVRGRTKLNIRSPVHTTFKKNVRRHRKRRSAGRKTKFPQCTSKTLITIAPVNKNDENMIKSININNDNINTKMSPSLFSLKNSLINKQSSTSTVMPVAKHTAQLTSKNNNKLILKMKRRRSSSISTTSGRKLKRPTRRGMTLRSRTIIINNVNPMKRKGGQY